MGSVAPGRGHEPQVAQPVGGAGAGALTLCLRGAHPLGNMGHALCSVAVKHACLSALAHAPRLSPYVYPAP